MKKIYLFTFYVLGLLITNAQVGIGTQSPDPSSSLHVESPDKGFLPPRLATDGLVLNPAEGLVIYDMSDDCLNVFNGTDWIDICSSSPIASSPAVSSLDNCSTLVPSSTLTENSNTAGVYFDINYSGGNGEPFSGEVVTSTGVALTATLDSGTLETGSGSVRYNLSGSPTTSGTASFTINLGGETCTVDLVVEPEQIQLPSSIVLSQDLDYFIVSVFDQDYLPYSAPSPTSTATTATVNADNANETDAIDIPGILSVSGVNIQIPVTTSGSGTLPAYTQTVTVPSILIEGGGAAQDVTLSWSSQSYTPSTTTITATLKAESNQLNLRKLDLNAGLGGDNLGILLASFTYPYNAAGDLTSYDFRVTSGVPDANIADANHRFIYIPITSATGEVWLNNNLGADYSNIESAEFNPSQQATSSGDFRAYGSIFQWGRFSDGHEIINWTSSTGSDGAEQNRERSNLSTMANPGHSDFIRSVASTRNWYFGTNPNRDSLWQGANGFNNPCPVGFRLPVSSELQAEIDTWSSQDLSGASTSALKLTAAGRRFNNNGALNNSGNGGRYHSSTPNGVASFSLELTASDASLGSLSRATGYSVRCIKD